MYASPFKLALSHQNKLFGYYKSQVQQQLVLLGILKEVLPAGLKLRAQYCTIVNRRVLVYTDTSIWASQLRFYATAMLELARAHHPATDLEAVQIRILVPLQTAQHSLRRPNLPSMQVIKEISTARVHHQEDELSLALRRLGETLTRITE